MALPLWRMLTVRTLRPDEADAAADLTARIFADPEEREGMRRLLLAAYADCPFMRPENCLVGEIDGKLVTKWQLLNFEMRIAGTIIPMCGVQGVAAEPDENHKGYARQVAEGNLHRLADLGFDFALGFAQRGAFYLRMGAVPVTADYTITLDAYKIARLDPDPFREFDVSRDVPSVIHHYNQANTESTGPLIRSEALWPWLVRKAPAIHVCKDGYLGVRYDEEFIEIREVVGSGPDFYEAALGKLALLARERGQRRIHGPLPPDHPLCKAALRYGAEFSSSYTKKSGCLGFAPSASSTHQPSFRSPGGPTPGLLPSRSAYGADPGIRRPEPAHGTQQKGKTHPPTKGFLLGRRLAPTGLWLPIRRESDSRRMDSPAKSRMEGRRSRCSGDSLSLGPSLHGPP